jgi:hypothetical protein
MYTRKDRTKSVQNVTKILCLELLGNKTNNLGSWDYYRYAKLTDGDTL